MSSGYFFIVIFFNFSLVGPQLFLPSNRLIAEEKQNVTIACTASGQPHPSITWSKAFYSLPKDKGVVESGALTIYNVAKNDGGIYMCKAENILGQDTSTVLVVVFSPHEVTPLSGFNVRLPCLAESDLKPTVTWEKKDKLLLPVDTYVLRNGTLLFRSIKKSHEGCYICRATNARSTIETKVKINSPVIATSCSVVKKYFSSVSGNYVIDPDGEGRLAPFTVLCDMTDKSGVGVTVIDHDSERRTHVNGYSSQGSYSRDIHYTGASLSQQKVSHCEIAFNGPTELFLYCKTLQQLFHIGSFSKILPKLTKVITSDVCNPPSYTILDPSLSVFTSKVCWCVFVTNQHLRFSY